MTTSPTLDCKNLYKSFGQHRVLQGIDFSVEHSGIHGMVGLNGAGKTTTLECLLGLKTYDSADISILGLQPHQLYLAQGRISVVFDSPCLHPQLTVRQTLDYSRLNKTRSSLRAQDVERLLGIERYTNFKIRQLSLGNRRRTSIAQALISRPQFVVLDEPFNGLDAGGVEELLQLIRQLNQEQETSFLLASHQLSYLEKICSHLAILHEGKIHLNQSMETLLCSDDSLVTINTGDHRQARIVLSQIEGVELLPSRNTDIPGIDCRLKEISSAQINAKLVNLGIEVEQLILHKPSLESLFHTIVEGKK